MGARLNLILLGCLVLGSQGVAGQPLTLRDAVTQALKTNPAIRLSEQQVAVARGSLEQASSAFDTTVSSRITRSIERMPTTSQQEALVQLRSSQTDALSYGVQTERKLRSGLDLTGTLSSSGSYGTESRLSGAPQVNSGRLEFGVVVPLGRNTGRALHTSESAAAMELQATRDEYQQVLAENVYLTVASYWSLLAARASLELAKESESALFDLRSELLRLVESDERPRADLVLLQANLLNKTSQRVQAEKALFDAQRNLSIQIGLESSDLSRLEPLDTFPAAKRDAPPSDCRVESLLDAAVKNRADLRAAAHRVRSASLSVDAASLLLKPRIDLRVSMGYSSLNEKRSWSGTAWPYTDRTAGPNAAVALTWEQPVENGAAQSRLAQLIAQRQQSEIRLEGLRQSVAKNTQFALRALEKSQQQLRASAQSIELYGAAVANEQTKNRLGLTTLIDVLSVNEMLLGAKASHISNQAAYMTHATQLLLETGALVEFQNGGGSVNFDQLTSPACAPLR